MTSWGYEAVDLRSRRVPATTRIRQAGNGPQSAEVRCEQVPGLREVGQSVGTRPQSPPLGDRGELFVVIAGFAPAVAMSAISRGAIVESRKKYELSAPSSRSISPHGGCVRQSVSTS